MKFPNIAPVLPWAVRENGYPLGRVQEGMAADHTWWRASCSCGWQRSARVLGKHGMTFEDARMHVALGPTHVVTMELRLSLDTEEAE